MMMGTRMRGMALALAVMGWALGPAGAARAAAPNLAIGARAAELVDASTGRVLYAVNPRERLPMASVTKLMTLYLAVQAIRSGRIHLSDTVPVSLEAYRIGGSQIWLEPKDRLTVDQMLKGIAVGSANDAAYALGEYLAGSESAFVAEMNRTAARLGMDATHFVNPHGLPEANHYTTASDLARLGERAVALPLLLHYTAMREDRTIRNGKGGTLWLVNHNRLLGRYPGADGLKTGYTRQAGYCMVATAKRGQTRLVAVILGAPSSQVRFADAAAMMTWGFTHYRTVPVAAAGERMATVKVLRGTAPAVQAIVTAPVRVTVSTGRTAPVEGRVVVADRVTAPVKRGQRLGTLEVRMGNRVLGRFALSAATGVKRLSYAGLFWRTLWRTVGGAHG